MATLNGIIANQLFNDKNFINVFENLYFRWLDEHEYEDINDYVKPLNSYVQMYFGTQITKMTKRPFGFQIKGNYDFKMKDWSTKTMPAIVSYTIKANGQIGWAAKVAA